MTAVPDRGSPDLHPQGQGPVPPEIPPPWRPEPPEEPQPGPAPTVPVVPVPGQRDAGIPSVADALLQRRVVLVSGRLTDETAATAAAQVMLLDAEDDAPLEVHLAAADGDLGAALMLADTVDLATAPVTVVCRGAVGGPVLAVVAAAPRRVAYPHAQFRLEEPRLALSGRADEIDAGAQALRQQLTALHERLAEATGQPVERIEEDLRHGRLLTARQAVDYGLVEEVAAPRHP